MTTTAKVLMEESNQKGDFNIASKNVGSFVKINSISIDLADVNAKSNDGKCDHFSIRGYVSEVRKKNWKLCWPFDLDDEQIKLKEQTSLLPPLTSPKFRYWSCKCCVEKFSCTGTEKDRGTRSNNCNNTLSKSKSDCCHIPSPCSTTMSLANTHQALKTNLAETRKDGVCTSTNGDSKHIHRDKKALLAAQVHTSFTGIVNGSANVTGNEFPGVTSVPEEINLNVMQEKPGCHTESRKDEETRPVDSFEHSREKYNVTDVACATPVGACETSTMSCVAENPLFVDERLDMFKIASGSSTLAGSSDGAAKNAKKSTNGRVVGLLDDRDHASSDSAEIIGSRGVQGHKSSSPSGPQRRRTRKIRLLTELLLESGEAKTEKASKDIFPVSVVNGESTGAGGIPVLQGQKSSPDNCKDNGLNDNKKRKYPRDDEWKSPEINLNKKLKSFKESEGNDASALAGSERKGDASTGLYPQANRKTQWSKHGSDKLPLSDKRKNKKKQTGVNVHSYLVPVGENFPNPGLDAVWNSNKGYVQDGVSFRAVNEASASRGLDKTSLSTPRMEKKASLTKSKGKMPKLDSVRSSQYHWSDAGSVKSSPIVRNEGLIQSGSLHVPFRQVDEASVDTGLQLSLGGSAAPIKGHRKYTPRDGDGISPLVWQEGTPVDEPMKKMVERNYISEPTVPPKANAYPFYKKRAHDDVHGQFVTYAVPGLSEKQNSNSQTEGRRSLGKHVDTSGANNGPKTIKIKEHPTLFRKGAGEIADRASEKGSADEFPMDIVELLARIQYEKGLPIPENRKNLLKVASEGRKTTMLEYDRLYSTDRLRTPEDASKRPNPQARSGRSEVAMARKSLKPIKQKLVEQFPNGNGDHVNGGHLVQKKSSSAIQISGPSPTECSCAQNCQWNANMLGHGFLNTSIERGACNTCPVGQRSMGEAAQAWPSAVPLERPTKYNVPPQKVGPQRNNIQIASSGPSLQHKGDYMSREQEVKYQKHYATNLETPGQHVVSETFSQRNTEYTYVNKHNRIEHQQNLRGSLDLYSNETIPAMHLLSLVTAGLSSAGPTFKTPGNAKYLERDCPENNSKEYPQMMAGVYNKPKDVAKDPVDNHGKNQLVVKSHDFFPVNPMAGPSSSLIHQEKGFQRANDFMGQVPFSSRGKEKVQRSSAALPAQNRGKALNSAYASGGYSPSHSAVPVPVPTIQKGFIGASSSMVPLLQPRAAEYPTELRLGSPHATGTFRPLKSRTEFMVCTVNRNPADFSVPGAENEYMIRGENLKVKKSRKRRGSAALDQQRPQKHAKRTAEKEQA